MNYLFSILFGVRRHVRKSNLLLKFFMQVLKKWNFAEKFGKRMEIEHVWLMAAEENKQASRAGKSKKWLGWANTERTRHTHSHSETAM